MIPRRKLLQVRFRDKRNYVPTLAGSRLKIRAVDVAAGVLRLAKVGRKSGRFLDEEIQVGDCQLSSSCLSYFRLYNYICIVISFRINRHVMKIISKCRFIQ